MNNEINKLDVDKSKLKLVGEKRTISDQKFDTKAVSYGRDVFRRLLKDKIATGGAIVVIVILLLSFLVTTFSKMGVNDYHEVRGMRFSYCLPKNKVLSKIGIMDGAQRKVIRAHSYDALRAISAGIEDKDGSGEGISVYTDSEYSPITKVYREYTSKTGEQMVELKIDTYKVKGFYFQEISPSVYDSIKELEASSGLQIIYPMVDDLSLKLFNDDPTNFWGVDPPVEKKIEANIWYKTDKYDRPIIDENGKFTDNYLRDKDGNVLFYRQLTGTNRVVRLYSYNFYIAQFGKEPMAFFGTDDIARDVFVRTMSAIGLSFMLGTLVFVVNFIIGAIVGAIRGFYGGRIDLYLTTILQILDYLPFLIILMLVRDKLIATEKISPFIGLLIAYIALGWIGTSGMFRTQFYRFKNLEYVMASRTLGASSARLMFKHIFPNSIGYAITATAFAIPGIMISETTLSFLGIASASKGNSVSLGTIVQTSQQSLSTFPHMMIPSLLAFALLILAFALFSNGLRDAFNPTLRGK